MPASMPRELVRWIQTLDLPLPIKQPKRDLANGYLFGEIVARYWNNVDLHSLENKLSKVQKEANWKVLRRTFQKNSMDVPEPLVIAIIESHEGAAQALLEMLYTRLTQRQLQMAPPLQEPEVPSVPTFLKSTTDSQVFSPMAPAADVTPRHDEQQQEQQEAEERERAERERAAARRTAALRPKPKATQKPAAIKAVPENEGDDGEPPVQFAAVTVKALPASMLSRFGGASRESAAAGGQPDEKSRVADARETIITQLSSTIDRVLQDTRTPPFPLTSGAPTTAEFFAQQGGALEARLRQMIWNALIAGLDDAAKWLASKPMDFPLLLAFDAAALRGTGGAEKSERPLRHLTGIISLITTKSPAASTYILRRHFLPHILPTLLGGNDTNSGAFRAACDVLRHFVAVGDDAAAASAMSAVHESLCSDPRSQPSLASEAMHLHDLQALRDGVDGYGRFLAVTERLVVAASAPVQSARILRGRPSVVGVGAGGGLDANADNVTGGAGDRRLALSQLAAVAYYNCVGGMHSESPAIRAQAVSLLATLARCGRARWLFDGHLELLHGSFGTAAQAGSIGYADLHLAKVELLCAALAVGPQVLEEKTAELVAAVSAQASLQPTPRQEANDGAAAEEVTADDVDDKKAEREEAVANAVKVLEAEFASMSFELEKLLHNVISAATTPSSPLPMGYRLQLIRATGAALRFVSDADAATAAASRLLSFALTSLDKQQQLALFGTPEDRVANGVPSAWVSCRSRLSNSIPVASPAPVQSRWPPLLFATALRTQIQEQMATAGDGDAAKASPSLAKAILSRLNDALNNDASNASDIAATLGPTAFGIQWLHTVLVRDRGANASVVSPATAAALAATSREQSPSSPTSADGDAASGAGGDALTDETNDEITAWWEIMKFAEPLMNAVLYIAEMLESRRSSLPNNQPQAEGTPAWRLNVAGDLCDSLSAMTLQTIVRFYVDISGVSMSAQQHDADDTAATIYENEAVANKAREWFQTIVANAA